MKDETELGMYRVNDDDCQKVQVGDYVICRQDKGSVWIQSSDGEGGSFSNESFEKVIKLFFRSNF